MLLDFITWTADPALFSIGSREIRWYGLAFAIGFAIGYKIVEKTGDVVGVKAVNEDHEIMMITTEGIIIQLRMQDISTLGRITSGVKMMNLDDGIKVAQIAKVRGTITSDAEAENADIVDAESVEEIAEGDETSVENEADDNNSQE